MNIYLIEDDEKRHRLLGDLLYRLNTNSSISYEDGFDRQSKTAYLDHLKLIKAISDPEGVLLLDIELLTGDPSGIPAIISNLKMHFQDNHSKIIEMYDRGTEISPFKSKPVHYVASFILAASLVLNRRCILITGIGREKDEAQRRLLLANCTMPKWDKDKKRWDQPLNDLVGEIKNLIEPNPFDKAAAAWDCLIRNANMDFRAASGWHTAKEWFEHMANSIPPYELSDRVARVVKVSQQLANEVKLCPDTNYKITNKCAISLCRGAHSSSCRLSLPFIKAIYCQNSENIESPFKCIETGRVSPGRVLLAISALLSPNNKEVIDVDLQVHLSDNPDHELIQFVAKYDSSESRDRAAETLSLTPFERLERDIKKNGPGEAVESCDWLRQASEQCSILPKHEVELRLSFAFNISAEE